MWVASRWRASSTTRRQSRKGDKRRLVVRPRGLLPGRSPSLLCVPREAHRLEPLYRLLDQCLVLTDDAERAQREGLEIGVLARQRRRLPLDQRPLVESGERLEPRGCGRQAVPGGEGARALERFDQRVDDVELAPQEREPSPG